MPTSRKRGVAAWTSVGLAGILLCSVSTAAMAAPAAPSDAKLQAMQQQLDAMRAQLDALQAGSQPNAQLNAMQQQLDAFGAQLAEMKTQAETSNAAIATLQLPPAANAVATTLPNGRPTFATTDGRFTANIRAILMMDAGKYFQDNNLPATVTNRDLNDGINFRRARIGFDGRLFSDFDYSFVYEFGGSGVEEAGRLYEASVTYTALKPFRLKVGAFEPNIGLAAATSTSQMPLLERPSPAEAARNVAAGDSRTAVQLSANDAIGSETGVAVRWLASGAFTGNTLGGTQQFDEQTAWIGRVALAPYSGVDWQAHLGGNIQHVYQPNDAVGPTGAGVRYPIQIRDRPELRETGDRLIDTGAIDSANATVYGGEAAFQIRNVLLEGELFRYEVERRNSALPNPHFRGWYVQGSWVLTGETRIYNPIEGRFDAPRQNYSFNPAAGTWGMFELAARYSTLDLNYREGLDRAATPVGGIRGGEQKILSMGANWYLNPSMRLMLDYQHVDIDRLTATGAQAGQEYDAIAARAQVTF